MAETLKTIGFAQLVKYDVATGAFEGVMASEAVDTAQEALDYDKSLPFFKRWVEESKRRSKGRSLGNVREMHSLSAVGKLTSVTFDDTRKTIRVRGRIVDAAAREKAAEGILTGLSIGGAYLSTYADHERPGVTRYVAQPSEVSLVDTPCNPDATFELVADGATKVMKFARLTTVAADVDDDETTPTGTDTMATQVQETAEERKARRQLKKAARKEKRRLKKQKLAAQALAYGIVYGDLSKAERKEFRARRKLEKALRRVEQIVAGPTRGKRGGDGEAIVGPVDASDEGKTGKGGEPLVKARDARDLSGEEIQALSAQRTRSSL